MKKTLSDKLPNSKEELNWIIDQIGGILFKNNWKEYRNVLIEGHCKECKIGIGIILTLNGCFKDAELNELVNHLFNIAIDKRNIILKKERNWDKQLLRGNGEDGI